MKRKIKMILNGAAAFGESMKTLALNWCVVVSFGGGLNSTAMLVRWVKKKFPPPAAIFFADTGNERKQTYLHIKLFSEWLVQNGFPPVQIIRKGGLPETLAENCLRMEMLPSLAYGRKGCSHKFKIEPQERECNRLPAARKAWSAGQKVVKIIGYGAEEQKRISNAKIEDDKYIYRFLLDEWGMFREDCKAEIANAGLLVPGKSSCVFCPANKKHEILALDKEDLALALRIESVAIASGKLKTSLGLGRRFSWQNFLNGIHEGAGEEVPTVCIHCIDQ